MFSEVHIITALDNKPVFELGWWPTGSLDARASHIQEQLLLYPHSNLSYVQGEFKSGAQTTLEMLWSLQSTPEKQQHLARAAILFYWLRRARAAGFGLESRWPPTRVIEQLYYDEAHAAGFRSPWHPRNGEVFPSPPADRATPAVFDPYNPTFDLRDTTDFLVSLDQEVARRLAYWQPVIVRYNQAPTTLVRTFRETLQTAEKSKHELQACLKVFGDLLGSRNDWRARAIAAEARLAALQVAEPFVTTPATVLSSPSPYASLNQLKKGALRKLVWAKPLRDVAAAYGVSDTHVRNVCTRKGVETPPRGYWLTVGHRQTDPAARPLVARAPVVR